MQNRIKSKIVGDGLYSIARFVTDIVIGEVFVVDEYGGKLDNCVVFY